MPYHIETEEFLQQAVPELGVVHFVFQAQLCHQSDSLERARTCCVLIYSCDHIFTPCQQNLYFHSITGTFNS